MTAKLKPILLVFLIDLLSRGGSIFIKDFVKPSYDPQKRRELIKLGFIAEEKVQQPKTKPIAKISITKKGWEYLSDNFDFPLKSGSKSVPIIFSRFLKTLSSNLLSKNLTIVELFAAPTKQRQITADELKNHIRRIYNEQLNLVMPGGGLRVTNLWKTLPTDFPLENLRALLLELQKKDFLVLYRFDDPSMVKDDDKKAEIFVAGEPRHYFFLK